MLLIEQFTFGYKNQVLKNALDLKVDSPNVVAILGNNGSGKSTFFNALRQKIHYSGGVSLEGINLKDFHLSPFAFLGQSYGFEIEIDVETFLKINLSNSTEQIEIYDFLFSFLEITELKGKSITELSQGQLQRCLIMQTLLQDSAVYLLDEPESFLDMYFRGVLGRLLKVFSDRFNKIILFATHDLSLVKESSSFTVNFSSDDCSMDCVTENSLRLNKEMLIKK